LPEAFITLPPAQRAEILQTVGAQLGLRAAVLEKDIWVCLILQRLFAMPGRMAMVLKGGTSLSKCFGAIKRFSEDIDITIDHRALDSEVDPYAANLSRTKRKDIGAQLVERLRAYSQEAILPYLQTALKEAVQQEIPIEALEGGESLRVTYSSALVPEEDEYLKEGVLLEFGGRSRIEPNQEMIIRPDITTQVKNLYFPEASVTVLSPKRTFWEKATLIHRNCHLGKWEDRSSRHWCDVAMLVDHDIGTEALADWVLLEDVVRTKDTMFYQARANYLACLNGGFRLVPSGKMLASLKDDFNTMKESAMFYEVPPSFEEIIERLGKLEQRINKGSEPS
jgi:hypothetical protein